MNYVFLIVGRSGYTKTESVEDKDIVFTYEDSKDFVTFNDINYVIHPTKVSETTTEGRLPYVNYTLVPIFSGMITRQVHKSISSNLDYMKEEDEYYELSKKLKPLVSNIYDYPRINSSLTTKIPKEFHKFYLNTIIDIMTEYKDINRRSVFVTETVYSDPRETEEFKELKTKGLTKEITGSFVGFENREWSTVIVFRIVIDEFNHLEVYSEIYFDKVVIKEGE